MRLPIVRLQGDGLVQFPEGIRPIAAKRIHFPDAAMHFGNAGIRLLQGFEVRET